LKQSVDLFTALFILKNNVPGNNSIFKKEKSTTSQSS